MFLPYLDMGDCLTGEKGRADFYLWILGALPLLEIPPLSSILSNRVASFTTAGYFFKSIESSILVT